MLNNKLNRQWMNEWMNRRCWISQAHAEPGRLHFDHRLLDRSAPAVDRHHSNGNKCTIAQLLHQSVSWSVLVVQFNSIRLCARWDVLAWEWTIAYNSACTHQTITSPWTDEKQRYVSFYCLILSVCVEWCIEHERFELISVADLAGRRS